MGRLARFSAGVVRPATIVCAVILGTIITCTGARAFGASPCAQRAKHTPADPARRRLLVGAAAVAASALLPRRAAARPHAKSPHGEPVAKGLLTDYFAATSPGAAGAADASNWALVVADALEGLRDFPPARADNPLRTEGQPVVDASARIMLLTGEELASSPAGRAVFGRLARSGAAELGGLPLLAFGQWAPTELGKLFAPGERRALEAALQRGERPWRLALARAVAAEGDPRDLALYRNHWDVLVNVDWLFGAAATFGPSATHELLTRGLLAPWAFAALPAMFAARPADRPLRGPGAWRRAEGDPAAAVDCFETFAALLEALWRGFNRGSAEGWTTARQVQAFFKERADRGLPMGRYAFREQAAQPGAATELALPVAELFIAENPFPSRRARIDPDRDADEDDGADKRSGE
ncbi:MAG: hypothetical protein IPL40_07710 [Proteobacteria bacterium]|nr:hypothetical protein [Pseudomonadota bacterium]